MHPSEDGRRAADWSSETLAGATGALTVLPLLLTLGLLAFAPLGAAAPAQALLSAFTTAVLGGLLHGSLSRTQLPVSGPSSPTALTLASLVVQLAADPRVGLPTAAGVQGIIALCGLAVGFSGLLQLAFALLGLARLARMIPQPVLAGFMNSAALLVLLAQVPLLLGLAPGTSAAFNHLAAAHPMALLLGLGTALLIGYVARRWPRLPAALLGLVAGCLAYALMGGTGSAAGAAGGPAAWPWPPALLPLFGPAGLDLLRDHAAPVALTALALAAIGALESSLNVRSVDQLLHTRHDPRHELLVMGWSNVACGLFGGLPLAASRTRALATLRAGGRGRAAALAGAASLGLLYLLGGPWLGLLPMPVLAGVMLTVAWGLADRWSGRMLARWWGGDHSRDLALGLGVVALVVGTTLWRGMAVGVALGVLLSLMSFAARMNRPLVHERYLASVRPSRRIYPAEVEARLQPLREGITVFELDGALFFGSSERLLDEADALAADCRSLVLDLRRVSAIDETGAVTLQMMVARLRLRGVTVDLAGLPEGSTTGQALRSFGLSGLPHWPDADRAIEAVELRSLAEAAGHGAASDARAMPAVPLAHCALLEGLADSEVAEVARHLQPRELSAGETLFSEGDAADRLYIVSQGSVSIFSAPDRLGRQQRYLSVSPGMMLGETAMLDGGGRSAGAVADAPAVVHALTQQALDEIGRSHPALAIRLYRNIALHLSQRLRGASGAWRSSAG